MTIKGYKYDPEKGTVDIQRLKKEYNNLINDVAHPSPCCCCSCLYQLYKKKYQGRGGKFDRKSFFLNELAFEVRLSKVWRTPILPDEPGARWTYRIELREFFGAPYPIKDIYTLIKKEFPDIDFGRNKITLRLRRLRESGIIGELEADILRGWRKAQSTKPNGATESEAWKKNWEDLKLAQKVANFIRSLPKKKISQRDLLRYRLRNKRKEDLTRIQDILKMNYGIESIKEGYKSKTTAYCIIK